MIPMRYPLTLAALAATAAAAVVFAPAQPPRVTKDAPRPAPSRPSTTRPAARPAPRPATAPASAAPASAAPAAAPAPVAAVAAARALADADVAFARQAGSGMREALLATLADDAILFHPRPVGGRAWTAASAFPAGQFTWAPAWAAVSADGTLGVTTGPIAFRADAPDSSTTGQYVTVWTRAAATAPWKALLQLTVPSPQAPEVTFAPHQPTGDGRPRGGPGAVEGSKATLFIADRGLVAAARANGQAAAVAAVALPDIHLLRANALPYVGVDSVRTVLAARDSSAKFASQIADLRMARSGDFGVAYGAYERSNAAGALTESGNYVRVWERQPDGGWRILLDASAPYTAR
jgi:ketosteroid isomerase-like protein